METEAVGRMEGNKLRATEKIKKKKNLSIEVLNSYLPDIQKCSKWIRKMRIAENH